jgi:RNA polymerase sigma factor (TIGR02999 family)
MTHGATDLTTILRQWRAGHAGAADRLLSATYVELKRIARRLLLHERQSHTLQPTALVHEAFLRLFQDEPVDLESRHAFFSLIATQMRRELIDHARRRLASKRGGHLRRADPAELDAVTAHEPSSDEQLFARLEVALARFDTEHPRAASVVRFRYLAGLTTEETAEALSLSTGTVKRDFVFARAWLGRCLDDPKNNS